MVEEAKALASGRTN